MEPDDDVPLILTWDEANSGLLNEDTERRDESKFILSSSSPSCYIHIIHIIYTVQSRCALVLRRLSRTEPAIYNPFNQEGVGHNFLIILNCNKWSCRLLNPM